MPLVLDGTTGFSGGGGVATSTALGSSALFTNSTGTNLVAIGYQAGYFTTAGPNVFVGSQAGYTNSTGTNNVGIGYQALYSNTTAAYNTAVGYQAGYANSTGTQNTAMGFSTLRSCTTAQNNAAFGDQALQASTTASYNTAVGSLAGYNTTTGANNVAIGYTSLNQNITGSGSTAVGYQALYTNTVSYNTAVGYQTLYANTTGQYNVAIGGPEAGNTVAALRFNTTGSYNNALGSGALGSNTTGGANVAIGYQSMYTNTTGYDCVAVGYKALFSHTTGDSCVAIGSAALQSLTAGRNNTAIGYQSGYYSTALTTGAQNILLGAYTRTSSATATYQYVIGYDISGQADNNVTIGSQSGKIYNSFTANATWTQTSDGRLKKNIQNETLGLSFINRLRPVKYEWKASNELEPENPLYSEENNRATGVTMHGLIAQEVKAALDAEGVDTFAGWDMGPDGIQAISREMFVSPLIKAIQELKTLVDAQAAEIVALKAKVGL